MKICPVCSARCFDDMDVCYGCLHTFTNQDVGVKASEVAYGGNEKTEEEFVGFEPEPISEIVAQQAIDQSRSYEPHKQHVLEESGSRKRFTMQVDIDYAEQDNINVSIRMPSDAMRMLRCD